MRMDLDMMNLEIQLKQLYWFLIELETPLKNNYRMNGS
jgi:hypothetical protein